MGSAYGSGSDTLIPGYVAGVQVTNGVPWYGPLVSLDRAASVSIQAYSPTVSGSIQYLATNFSGNPACTSPTTGYPFPVTSGSLTLSAAGTGAGTLVSASALAYNAFYLTLTPTGSGLLYVSINIRHYN